MKNFKKLIFSLILIINFNAQSLIISSQETLAAHINLSHDVPFAQISTIGGGIAINKQWILTAAHVANGINPDKDKVIISGHSYKIIKVFIHPRFNMSSYSISHDIALIHIENDRSLTTKDVQVYPNIVDKDSYQLGSKVLMIGM